MSVMWATGPSLITARYETCVTDRSALEVVGVVFRYVRKFAKSDSQLRHVCQSVRPHGTTRLPMGGFS
jgi:hypothetical protein